MRISSIEAIKLTIIKISRCFFSNIKIICTLATYNQQN
jgi:hypothetical protein